MEVKSCFPYIGPNVKSVEKIWTSRGGAEGRTWPLKLWITRLGREFWSLHCSLALTKYDFWTSSQQDRHYLKQELFCLHRLGFQSVINTSFKLNFPWKTTIKGMNYLLNLGYSWWNLELRVASVEPKPLLSFCHDHNNRMFNHRQRMSWPRGFLCLSCSKAKNSQAAMAQSLLFSSLSLLSEDRQTLHQWTTHSLRFKLLLLLCQAFLVSSAKWIACSFIK